MADVIGRLTEGGATPGMPSDSPQSIFRGVVIEVIHDPSIYDEEQFEDLESLVKEAKMLETAPRNTCLVQISFAGSAQRKENSYMVCYPFFPPYLGMPIKPGEHVWVFVEDTNKGPEAEIGYWICRISEPLHIDDLNYTHSDRNFGSLTTGPDDQEAPPLEEDDRGLGFPNGAGLAEGQRLSSPKAFEEIYSGSLGMQSVTLEPVPRFTKRPGDLVLQGSNNTCITLGEDRGWTKDTVADSTTSEWSSATSTGPSLAQANYETPPEEGVADPNERTFAGTIDIVAGRGRYLPDPDSPAELTSARIVTNAREYDEVDKNPTGIGHAEKDFNRIENPAEGDPDFFNDASRIYVSMNTLPDFNFSLEYPDVPPAGDPNDGAPVEILEEFAEGKGQAAVIMKSDEIRIIARQDMEQDEPIQGSITIVKEGTADDEAGEGRAIITLRPDGVIMIDGPKIVIGSGIEKGPGEGAQVSLGLAATEPMLLGDLFIEAIDTFANALLTDVNTSVSNLGAPIIMANLATNVATLKADMDNARSKIAKLL